MQAFELAQLLKERKRSNILYLEFLKVPDLSMGLYVLPAGGTDPQSPHVVVFDKSENLGFEVVSGDEVAAFNDFSNQAAEPNFDLIHPGSMIGCVMKNHALGWVAQKGSPRSFGFQNTRFALQAWIDSHV